MSASCKQIGTEVAAGWSKCSRVLGRWLYYDVVHEDASKVARNRISGIVWDKEDDQHLHSPCPVLCYELPVVCNHRFGGTTPRRYYSSVV